MTAAEGLLAKRARLAGSARELLNELRTNRRAVAGLMAIAVLIGGYGLLVVDDAIDAARSSYIQAAQRLRRIAASDGEKEWPARAKESAAQRQALETRVWPAESEGMAQANLQDWVTAAGRDAGLDKLRVRVELTRPKGLAPDLRQVVATITATQTEPALIEFLARVEREKRLLVVDRLHVRERPVTSLDMTLTAYAKLARGLAEVAK